MPVLFPEFHSQGLELHPTIIAPKARERTHNEPLRLVLLDVSQFQSKTTITYGFVQHGLIGGEIVYSEP